mgnify:FL=1
MGRLVVGAVGDGVVAAVDVGVDGEDGGVRGCVASVTAGVVTSAAVLVRAAGVCGGGAVVAGAFVRADLGGEDVMRPAAEAVAEVGTSAAAEVVVAAVAAPASSCVYSVSSPPAPAQK